MIKFAIHSDNIYEANKNINWVNKLHVSQYVTKGTEPYIEKKGAMTQYKVFIRP